MTPEGKVKDKIKKLLVKHGAYFDMPVSNGMGKPSLDFIVCSNGYYMGLEAKAEGKTPTPRQLNTMRQMAEAGAAVMVVHDEASLEALDAWLLITSKVTSAKVNIQEGIPAAKKQHLEDQRKKYEH